MDKQYKEKKPQQKRGFYESEFNRLSVIFISVTFVSGSLFAIGLHSLYNLYKYSQLGHLPQKSLISLQDDVSLVPLIFPPEFGDHSTKQQSVEKGSSGSNKKEIAKIKNEQEALSSMKVAIEMKQDGKDEKALRLFEHALALAPRHPDIITSYGEFLEQNQNNVITADEMYHRALIISPKHESARCNRKRTAPLVEILDQKRLVRLDEKRNALSGIHETNSALRRAKKEAYIQHIYHSVGIEGNTMTLAQTRSILETRMAVEGKSIDEHNEIIGLDAAMKYINASLVNKVDLITLNDILELHKRVLGHVDPIEGGVLRETQVYVGSHIPPGPNELRLLMDRFETWLNSEYALTLHPIRYAALAHYKLVHIHPFTDGNGRTSRLLMNLILMRAGYPPIIIQKHQRHKYYNFLQTANEGDARPFIRFIADCTERTLDLYLWATSDLSHPVPLLSQGEDEEEGRKLITEFVEMNSDSQSDTIRL